MILIIDLRDYTIVDKVTEEEFEKIYKLNYLNGILFKNDIMVLNI